MKTLIIAEKPSVAGSFARYFNGKRIDNYYESEHYIITNVLGHLLTLYNFQDYDESMKHWSLEKYPYIPEKFKYKLIDNKGVKDQFCLIKKLVERDDVNCIINAGDNDREGELVVTLVLKAIKTNKQIKRLLLDEHTPKDIKKGMENLKDNDEMRFLQDAASARQLTDSLIGFNFTSVATMQYNPGQTLKIGRVLMPTVNIIYTRDMEIENFKESYFYQIKGKFKGSNGEIEAFYIKDNNIKFNNKKDLQVIVSYLNKQAIVKGKEVTLSKKGPEKLYNLAKLQGYMSRKFDNWDSSKVLKIAQSLYEKKCLSYPRTESRHLKESLKRECESILLKLVENESYKDSIKFNNNIFDDNKVDSHGAIRPTYIIPNNDELSEDEKILYEVVKKSFIAQFMAKAEYEVTELTLEVGDQIFVSKGKVLKTKGFLELYNSNDEDSEIDDLLPSVEKNEVLEVVNFNIEAKKTQPPKHHTEDTLIDVMLNCGNNVENEMDILEGYKIGTAATRDDIIKKMQTLKYVKKKGKSFYITELGKSLVECFPASELLDLDYTGKLEKKLKSIENGKLEKELFMSEMKEFVIKGVNLMKEDNSKIKGKDEEKIGVCLECGGEILENTKSFYCKNYKEGCKFSIFKEDKFLRKLNIKLNKTMVTNFLEGRSILIFNLKSKNDKLYDALLEFKKNANGYWNFGLNFDFEYSVVGKCPTCSSNVTEKGIGYTCTNKDCKFIIWRDNKFLANYKKKLTAAMVKKLLKDGKVEIKGLFSAKKQKKFDAKIVLDITEEGYVNLKFDF